MSMAQTTALTRPAYNYRQLLSMLVPAFILAYVLLIWPLLYGRNSVSADLLGAAALPSSESGFLLNKLVFPALFCLTAMLYLAERPAWPRHTRLVSAVLFVFLAYCGASAAWAVVPSRTISQLGLVVLSLATVGFAAQVARNLDGMFKAMFWVFAVALAVNLASVLLTAPGPIGHQGIYPHKNGLGAVAAMASMIAFYGISQRAALPRLVGLAMLPAALFILRESESKTALGLTVLVPALSFACWLAMRYLRIALPIVIVLGLLVTGLLGSVLFSQGFSLGDISMLIGNDRTFTGRTDIWEFAAAEIAKQPLLGHGFSSFWGIGDLSPALQAAPGFIPVTPTGHNGYVDLLLELGMVGLGLFTLLLLCLFGRLQTIARHAPAIAFAGLALLIYLVLQNLLETTWLEPLDAGTTIIAVLLFAPVTTPRSRQP